MKAVELKSLSFAVLALTLGACSNNKGGSSSSSPQAVEAPASDRLDATARDLGKPMIQRLVTQSVGEIHISDLCLITDKAVTNVKTSYDSRTQQSQVKSAQKFMDLSSEDLKRAIAEAIQAPKVEDSQSKAGDTSTMIFLFDNSKEVTESHVLFSQTASGTEKRDAPMAPSIIAATNQLCAQVVAE